MYVISGITGNTGSATANALLEAGHRVRAIVRDVARAEAWQRRGVELVQGDLSDSHSLSRAFEGAEGAYMLVPPDPHHPDPIGHYRRTAEGAAEAARAAGLPRMVFLSSEGAHLTEGTGPILGAHYGEEALVGATPHMTFLRPSYFQENWQPVFGLAKAQGVMPSLMQPLDAARSQVATFDIGETVAALLTEAEPPAVVELSGPEPFSAADAASAMTKVLGREVTPVALPREAWAETLEGSGVSRAYAELICEMYDGINAGHIQFSRQAELRVGRRTLVETIGTWRI
jgi:uncharacterized protein YbjT (DUF2867 family)